MKFNETFTPGELIGDANQETIRQMIPIYRADMVFAYKHSNEPLRKFLDGAPIRGLKHISVDVKLHMLKDGWFPGIPGWHLDDFYRPNKAQPEIAGIPNNLCYHHMVVFGDSSLTEVVAKPIELPLPPEGEKVYRFYNI